ncbi:MAG: hypothetical protein IPG89_07150 [Bacteroidetes bacterium]|nr:hypothetical protein [Bacteroidota bacterium]
MVLFSRMADTLRGNVDALFGVSILAELAIFLFFVYQIVTRDLPFNVVVFTSTFYPTILIFDK